MTNYRQIFKSTGLLGSVQVLYILVAVIRNKLAAILIGPAGMGLADLYSRTLELIGSSTNMGFGLSSVKVLSEIYQKEEEEKDHTAENALTGTTASARPQYSDEVLKQVCLIRTWVLLLAVFGALICLVLSPLISQMAMGNKEHTLQFCLLAPTVAFSTAVLGEISILKATRKLKLLARASAYSALSTLLISAPLYYVWGMKGIVPVLVLTAASMFVFNLREATRFFPYRLGFFKRKYLEKGYPMIRLGIAYVLAGVMTSGAELFIRAFLARTENGWQNIAFYAAGFTLIVSYARLIFVAMDADYFPRLTAVIHNRREMNVTINRQINTLIVLMGPFLMMFCLALPLIIRILYTTEFLVIIPMVLCAAPYMFFKAIYTPIAYITLANGSSVLYMIMEFTYDIIFCLLVVLGFHFYGLLGAGVALSIANLFDLCLVSIVYKYRFGYQMNRETRVRCLLLFLLLIAGLAAASHPLIKMKLLLGGTFLLMTIPVIWPVLKKIKRK